MLYDCQLKILTSCYMDKGFHFVPIDRLVNAPRLAIDVSKLDVHHHVGLIGSGQLLQGETLTRVSGRHLLNVQAEDAGGGGDHDDGE